MFKSVSDVKTQADMQKAAVVIAHTLQSELSFPGDMEAHHKAALVERLYDAPPSRKDLAFQIIGGLDGIKATVGPLLADDAQMHNLFCMVHTEFVPQAGMDIEHAFAHSDIKKKQEAFLTYLNRNREFADLLLAQPHMQDFFRREQGVVKGTGYFYKICYNDTENLWLLCHACNIKKTNADPMKWFKDQEVFGERFLQAVKDAGGLQNGLILDRIYHPDTSKDQTIAINKTRAFQIHNGPTKGLGEFVRTWYHEQYHQSIALHREFYTKNFEAFKKRLARLVQAQKLNQLPRAEKIYKRLFRSIKDQRVVQATQDQLADQLSDSSYSDNEAMKQAKKDRLQADTTDFVQTGHDYKHIQSLMEQKYPGRMENIAPAAFISHLDAASCQVIYTTMEIFLQKAPLPTEQETTQQLSLLVDANKKLSSTEHRVLQESLDQERVARIQAEQQAQRSQDRVAQLEAQLAALKLAQPQVSTMPPASRDFSATAGQASFSTPFRSVATGNIPMAQDVWEPNPKRRQADPTSSNHFG